MLQKVITVTAPQRKKAPKLPNMTKKTKNNNNNNQISLRSPFRCPVRRDCFLIPVFCNYERFTLSGTQNVALSLNIHLWGSFSSASMCDKNVCGKLQTLRFTVRKPALCMHESEGGYEQPSDTRLCYA